jgi:hypothetical protein
VKHHTGRVVEFDGVRGLGVVESDDGTRWAFHCTRVAGGSRAVSVGAAVRYSVLPAVLGRWEATDVEVAGS